MSQTKTPWGKFSVYLTNICLMMVILMVSSPALPYITSEFGVTAAMAPWQNTLYTMSGAILSPVMGWIGDTKGAKKQMLSGIIIFIVGNLLCAVSPNFLVFCIGRFFAGFGLAAVIIGTTIFKRCSFIKGTTAVLIGSIVYKTCIQIAISLGLPANLLKLITAVLFLIILVIGNFGESRDK